MERMTGVLRHWSVSRAFGFVRTTSLQGVYSDFFLHVSKLKAGIPCVGASVEFTPGAGIKGPTAQDAVILTVPTALALLSGGK